MADVVAHPGRTGAYPAVQVEDDGSPPKRPREDSGPTLLRVLLRGKASPMSVFVAALLFGGGSGIGGSWLLGPGGWSDESAVRIEQAEMRKEMRDGFAGIRAQLETCEADIDVLDDGQADLMEAVSDTQVKHSKAITQIAVKLGIVEQIDVSPPRQRARRVRR